MPQPKHAMEIFQLLDKSNCRECGEKTCLAFAGAVFQGRRKIADCPKLGREIIERFSGGDQNQNNGFQEGADYLQDLKKAVAGAELAEAAQRVGAKFSDDKLTLKVLGKDFSVDTAGNLSADIHINPW
ncbi:MAG: (Fe-S)-binding protein, partial [Desulfobacteraceae bacterium]